MTTTNSNSRYYDVTIDMFIDGFEKSIVNRVYSNSRLQAIIDAISDEVHTLDGQEVADIIEEQNKTGIPFSVEDGSFFHRVFSVEDGSFFYRVSCVIELEEQKVIHKDEVKTILLPKVDIYDRTKRYFID